MSFKYKGRPIKKLFYKFYALFLCYMFTDYVSIKYDVTNLKTFYPPLTASITAHFPDTARASLKTVKFSPTTSKDPSLVSQIPSPSASSSPIQNDSKANLSLANAER